MILLRDHLRFYATNCLKTGIRENTMIASKIKIIPKILLIVDGIGECAPYEIWNDRIKEASIITNRYHQIRFCFTSTSYAVALADKRKFYRSQYFTNAYVSNNPPSECRVRQYLPARPSAATDTLFCESPRILSRIFP